MQAAAGSDSERIPNRPSEGMPPRPSEGIEVDGPLRGRGADGPLAATPLLRRLIRLELSLGNLEGRSTASLILAIRLWEAGHGYEALLQSERAWNTVQESGFGRHTARLCHLLGATVLVRWAGRAGAVWLERALTTAAESSNDRSNAELLSDLARSLNDQGLRLEAMAKLRELARYGRKPGANPFG